MAVAKGSAVKAVAAEADEATNVEFDFDGVHYTVDPLAVNDIEILEEFEDGKIVGPVRRILGPEQWAAFKKKRRTGKELSDLVEVMFESIGIAEGELDG